MKFKDYYATLGVGPTATQDEIKRAYRKLARKYHPDLNKEPEAEARFKEVAEAHEALIDVERRAAYDDISRRYAQGQSFEPPPGWDSGFEFTGRSADAAQSRSAHDAGRAAEFSDFFESLFGRGAVAPGDSGRNHDGGKGPSQGRDHHAKVAVSLEEACRGTRRTIALRLPVIDATGHATLRERQLEVGVPAGVRPGQHLRLAGQGGTGQDGASAGDLYLEIQVLPHPVFRLDGGDIYCELPVSPWEAALGATVAAPTPHGVVQLSVPQGSSQGRKLRLKGKGLPGKAPGDLYAVLRIALPPAGSAPQKAAYSAFASAFPACNPRAHLET
jgi:curved DNA-binding protein